MENKFAATEDGWFIVKGENTHYGQIKSGETLATIYQIDTYQTEESWKEALKALGIEDTDNKPKTPTSGMPELPKFGNN